MLRYLERGIRACLFFVIAFMSISVLVQVFARTFMEQPPIWTEEAARVALLYIAGLGVGCSLLSGDLVNVDLALAVMPRRMRRASELLAAVATTGFGCLLIPEAWEFMQSGVWQTSPILGVRMDFVFASMLLFAIFLGLFGFIRLIGLLRHPEDGVLGLMPREE